jgi:hypothetical protein
MVMSGGLNIKAPEVMQMSRALYAKGKYVISDL